MRPCLCAPAWSAVILLLASGVSGFGSESVEFPRGQVIASVECPADPGQSYALYLPAAWDGRTAAPVLFCFEPGARGPLPVERFQPGAERWGYIIASSNNSRNGPFEPQRIAIEAMLNDVLSRFAIDRQRIVFTGMSGGARLAFTVAEKTGLARAVIACGAGFPRDGEPERIDFAVVGIVGIDDFNFFELRRTDAILAERGTPHRLLVFPGGHEWPPAGVAATALDWLELQAMRSGERETDPEFIASLLTRQVAEAEGLAVADRGREWRAISADFSGLADVAKLQVQSETLTASVAGVQAMAAERLEETAQEEALAELLRLVRAGEFAALRKRAARWRTAAAAEADGAERRVARRVVGDAATLGREGGQEAMRQRRYADAVNLLELTAAFRPERAPVWVDLARACAGGGDRRRARALLHHAVELGYADAASLEGFAEFEVWRDEAALQAILAAARRNATR